MTATLSTGTLVQALQDVSIDLLLETGGGGSGVHVLDLYEGLRGLGVEAHLLLSHRRTDPHFAERLAGMQDAAVAWLDLRRSPHPTDLPAIRSLRSRARQGGRRRVLHAHSTKAGIVGWGVRHAFAARVLTPHAYRGMDLNLRWPARTVVRRSEQLFSRAFDAVVAVSSEEAVYAKQLGIAADSIHYVPNGVAADSIRAQADAVRAARPAGPPVIGFVGRLVPQKHPELFLETLAALARMGTRFSAVVIGDGPLLPALRQQAAAAGIADRVQWLGTAPAVPELGRMDLFLHTSRYESLPYSLLEAAAAAVPILCVPNAGTRAIFGTGASPCTVESGTAEALAHAAADVLGGQPRAAECLAAERRVTEQFRLETMLHQTLEIYHRVLHHPARN